MKVSRVVIFLSQRPRVGYRADDRAQVHELACDAKANDADLTSEIVASLKTAGIAACEVTLALPTEWCLAASIAAGDLPARGQARLMLYRFEEQVPLAAEEMAVAFCPGKSSHLGVGVAAEHVLPFVNALESAGFSIAAIAPSALIALQSVPPPSSLPAAHAMIWQDGSEAELFLVDDHGHLTAWTRCPASAEAIEPNVLAGAAIVDPAPILCRTIDCDPSLVADLQASGRLRVEPIDNGSAIDIAAVNTMVKLAKGNVTPWPDLQTGPLAPKDPIRRVRTPLLVAIAASILVALSVAGVCLHSAATYRAQAGANQRLLDDLYRQALGKPPNGADVRARLVSEERRLRALSGDAQLDATRPASALAMMRSVLGALPRDLRYRVLDLRIEPDGLQVEGQARSHGDADAIAMAVRRDGSFLIDAPRTEARGTSGDRQGVSFTLTGKPSANGGGR